MTTEPFTYDGFVYVRPDGCGIVLEGSVKQLEVADLDEQPDGFYRAVVRFVPLPAGSQAEDAARAAVYGPDGDEAGE